MGARAHEHNTTVPIRTLGGGRRRRADAGRAARTENVPNIIFNRRRRVQQSRRGTCARGTARKSPRRSATRPVGGPGEKFLRNSCWRGSGVPPPRGHSRAAPAVRLPPPHPPPPATRRATVSTPARAKRSRRAGSSFAGRTRRRRRRPPRRHVNIITIGFSNKIFAVRP